MSQQQGDWPAARFVHLPGGCRAINNPGPEVDFLPVALNGKHAHINLRAYATIYADLERLGLPIIGIDFCSHILEVEERIPPNWRVYHKSPITAWPATDVATKWARIGHGAHERKNGRLWDLASRISHQMRVCSWRLREISEAYRKQLFAHVCDGEFRDGQRFEDGFTWLAYLSIQSFLVDACVLRDYLAEFAAHFIYGPRACSKKVSVTSMAGLKKVFLDKSGDSDVLSMSLREAVGEGGWLQKLGNYRDLVVHSAPLAKAQHKLLAVTEVLKLGESGGLPSVKCPIPDNPQVISSARAKGDYFENFTIQFETFIGAAAGSVQNRDGLIYAHEALGRLALLSASLSDNSPVPPEMLVLNESDLLGPVQIIHVQATSKC